MTGLADRRELPRVIAGRSAAGEDFGMGVGGRSRGADRGGDATRAGALGAIPH
ncbi:MAG TPA: hypothetical protein VER96_10040 [Polyangiaceae bacterium]|nr:hypothetical protein [Polyangiaceae bacterium]